jgi:hypothetical protein
MDAGYACSISLPVGVILIADALNEIGIAVFPEFLVVFVTVTQSKMLRLTTYNCT